MDQTIQCHTSDTAAQLSVIGDPGLTVSEIIDTLRSNNITNATLFKRWKDLARALKIGDGDILALENYFDRKILDHKDAAHQIILDWSSRNGRGATMENLIKIVKELGMADIADGLQNIIEYNKSQNQCQQDMQIRSRSYMRNSGELQNHNELRRREDTRMNVDSNLDKITQLESSFSMRIRRRSSYYYRYKTFLHIVYILILLVFVVGLTYNISKFLNVINWQDMHRDTTNINRTMLEINHAEVKREATQDIKNKIDQAISMSNLYPYAEDSNKGKLKVYISVSSFTEYEFKIRAIRDDIVYLNIRIDRLSDWSLNVKMSKADKIRSLAVNGGYSKIYFSSIMSQLSRVEILHFSNIKNEFCDVGEKEMTPQSVIFANILQEINLSEFTICVGFYRWLDLHFHWDSLLLYNMSSSVLAAENRVHIRSIIRKASDTLRFMSFANQVLETGDIEFVLGKFLGNLEHLTIMTGGDFKMIPSQEFKYDFSFSVPNLKLFLSNIAISYSNLKSLLTCKQLNVATVNVILSNHHEIREIPNEIIFENLKILVMYLHLENKCPTKEQIIKFQLELLQLSGEDKIFKAYSNCAGL